MRRPDAIYANTWPIVAQALLLIIAKMRRVPVVLSIQDLYPESLIVQKRGGVAAALAGLILAVDRWIGRSAAAFIVISPRMAEAYRVRRAVAAERIHIVPNWMSRDAVDITATGHELRSRMNIPEDAFLLVYGGNIGAAAGVETIIEAMRHVTNPRAILLVAGSGDRLVRCRSLAEESGRSRVRFLSPWMPEDTSGVLSAANLLVLPTRGQQSLASMPSKLITYMLAEKPVLAVASPDSDLASMVAACGCGWLSPPDDPGSMARAIDSVSRLSVEELSRAGRSARNFALEHLVEEACVPAVVAAIERASRGDRS